MSPSRDRALGAPRACLPLMFIDYAVSKQRWRTGISMSWVTDSTRALHRTTADMSKEALTASYPARSPGHRHNSQITHHKAHSTEPTHTHVTHTHTHTHTHTSLPCSGQAPSYQQQYAPKYQSQPAYQPYQPQGQPQQQPYQAQYIQLPPAYAPPSQQYMSDFRQVLADAPGRQRPISPLVVVSRKETGDAVSLPRSGSSPTSPAQEFVRLLRKEQIRHR